MRRFTLSFAFLTTVLSIAGCHSSTSSATSSGSLADKEARYEVMHQQYLTDCVKGTPEHVHANQSLCETERKKMTPLGDEVFKLEQEAAQHPNP
jgi:hypothetical protein